MNSSTTNGTRTLVLVSAGQAQRLMEALETCGMTRKRSSSFKSNSHQCWRACPTSGHAEGKPAGRPGVPLVEFPPDSQPFGEVPTEALPGSRVKLGNLLFLLRSMVQSIWRAPNAREREF